MTEFRAKISENGRIIIPAVCRRQLHLESGDDLIIRVDNNELRIYSAKHSLKKAQMLVKKHAKGKKLVTMLSKMRREELDNE